MKKIILCIMFITAVVVAFASPLFINANAEDKGAIVGENSLCVPITDDLVYTNTAYYHENPLGIAGGFHIVGFTSVSTNAHTNGNILTNSLNYMSNFGTNGLEEVSYIRNIARLSDGFKASQADVDSILVVGKEVTISTADNGNAWTLNGNKVDSPQKSKHPESLWQDTDIDFIDIEEVKNDIIEISKQLQSYPTTNIENHTEDPYHEYITILNTSGVNVYNYNFSEVTTSTPFNIHGFVKGSKATLIINVDAKGETTFDMPGSVMYYTDGSEASGGEVTTWEDANVIWNIYDSSKSNSIYTGTVSTQGKVTGHIIAPGATLNINSNLNGTMIADHVNVLGETHRSDFTGTTLLLNEEEFISIPVHKEWIDRHDLNGKRPDSIVVHLLANGTKIQSVDITADMNWEYVFTNLPKRNNNVDIVYTLSEDPIEDYSTVINGYTIINSYNEELINIPVEKVWIDEDDKEGLRPDGVTINLFSDGTKVRTQTVTSEMGWKYVFENLPKSNNDIDIVYTISEDAVSGYTSAIHNFTVTNTHAVETTSVTVEKRWNDSNNQDGIRPTSITVYLLANDEIAQKQIITAEMNWKYKFTQLDQYKNGLPIVYTVKEDVVENYTTSIENFTIINTHEIETVTIVVEQEWVDKNDESGNRPDEVTVDIISDDDVIKTIVLSKDHDWKEEITDLPKYKDGEIIVYTIKEHPIPGYKTTIEDYKLITSVGEPGGTPITGDGINSIAYVVLFFISIAALICVRFKYKKFK